MSFKGNLDQDQVCSTARLTSSEVVSNFSHQIPQPYDEEFTLMDKVPKIQTIDPKYYEKCLAYKVAQRFPKGIREEASKIVVYYQNALHEQLRQYHKLVEANTKLKRQNDKLEAENYSNQLLTPVKIVYKEGRAPLTPAQLNRTPVREAVTPEKIDHRKRIQELEDKVIARDKKINELNGEISQLSLKLRKYRKRMESTGVKE